jgi:hypothetical protein
MDAEGTLRQLIARLDAALAAPAPIETAREAVQRLEAAITALGVELEALRAENRELRDRLKRGAS